MVSARCGRDETEAWEKEKGPEIKELTEQGPDTEMIFQSADCSLSVALTRQRLPAVRGRGGCFRGRTRRVGPAC